ncbi:hypothetical protein ACVNHC_15280 [Pannonibacter sp. Q-1]
MNHIQVWSLTSVRVLAAHIGEDHAGGVIAAGPGRTAGLWITGSF